MNKERDSNESIPVEEIKKIENGLFVEADCWSGNSRKLHHCNVNDAIELVLLDDGSIELTKVEDV